MQQIGKIIRNARKNKRMTSGELATKVRITRPYLSKIENSKLIPSRNLIDLLTMELDLKERDKKLLEESLSKTDYKKRVKASEILSNNGEQMTKSELNEVMVRIPNEVKVLYSDLAFVTKTDFGVVLDFAQKFGSAQRYDVVSRIGISDKHARALLKVLKRKLME